MRAGKKYSISARCADARRCPQILSSLVSICTQLDCSARKWPQILFFGSQLARNQCSHVSADGTQIFLCPMTERNQIWEHVLTRSHAWISTCDGLAFSLRYTWDTPATHLRHIYETLEIHLWHTCDTFKIHLRELVSIARLAYTCVQLAHHLRYTCKTHLRASAHKINVCEPPAVNLRNLLWIYSMVKVIKPVWPLVWRAGSHCFLGVSNWWCY